MGHGYWEVFKLRFFMLNLLNYAGNYQVLIVTDGTKSGILHLIFYTILCIIM